MKGIIFPAPNSFKIEEMPDPAIAAPDDVLVRIRAGGICGSDMHCYHGTSAFARYPLIPGHEVSAEVVELGQAAQGLETGDHVVLDPVNSCGKCYPCLTGRYNVCVDLKANGAHTQGAFSEFAVFKRHKLHRISKAISWEHAAVVEPYTIAAQSIFRGRIQADDTVLIMGAGPIAMVILQASKMLGAKCIVSDISARRLERARQLGADYTFTAGQIGIRNFLEKHPELPGITLALDATGAPSVLPEIIANMLPTGRVVTLGFSAKTTEIQQLEITKRELDIMGSRLSCGQFPKVVEWVEKKLVDPSKIITHIFHFEEFGQAISLFDNKPDECCKIVLTF
ncbi:MAG: zinc-binding alcohol dehydrogenase family protein [Treponema sp.]|jgi:L-gulonate 5-dehydrogenase|nr:zinc-binding alcohol dehydrogenase family protein [Treponema sp.]